jgi:hypothetical protein
MVRYALVAAAALTAMPAAAHHTASMFAMDKEVTLTGTVREFQYTNPHSWIQLVVDDAGKSVEWSIETQAPIVLLRAGIKPGAFKPGDRLTVRLHPLKDGGPGGEMIDAKKDDGTVYSLRGPN